MMQRSVKWRIIDTGPRDPYTNMAIDEALLCGYEMYGSLPTLRVYGWEPAGISLGFGQDPQAALAIANRRGQALPIVRRITGGGIIVHANELTYSLVCSKDDLGLAAPKVVLSYKAISSFLISFYKCLGLDAAFACDIARGERLGVPSALCFASKEKYDIVIAGKKIGGSAQKRSRQSIFQHGSIPIAADTVTPGGAASLEELLGRCPDYRELSTHLVEAFSETFGVSAETGSMTDAEIALSKELRDTKYTSDEWNTGRGDVAARTTVNPVVAGT